MSYISNLRKYVGHEPIINIGSTLLVFNKNNEILLNLRTDTLTWGIPGGGKEINETLEECAIRELKEQANLSDNDLELVTVLSGPEYYFKYPNDDEVDTVITLYKVKDYDGELNITDGESITLDFFPLDNLPKLESRAEAIINKIKNGTIKI